MSQKNGLALCKFYENERVLCYQGPIIYEAKCLKVEVQSDGKPHYLVHYSGWNKHWDEWVTESRILKHNETNLIKQKECLKHLSKDKAKKSKSLKTVKTEKDAVEKKRTFDEEESCAVLSTHDSKRRRLLHTSSAQSVKSCQSIMDANIKIPKELKLMLADDWDLITRQKLICRLPAKFTVDSILSRFIEDKKDCNAPDVDSEKELVYAIRESFNVMLGSQLLYKFERPQYGDILERYSHKCVSQVYGAPHFVRFFVKCGNILLSNRNAMCTSLECMLLSLHEVLDYLKSHINMFFDIDEYETAPADYHRRALT